MVGDGNPDLLEDVLKDFIIVRRDVAELLIEKKGMDKSKEHDGEHTNDAEE